MKSIMHKLFIVALLALLPGLVQAADLISSKTFGEPNEIIVTFSSAIDKAQAEDIGNYVVYEEPDPDIRLAISSVVLAEDGKTATLLFADPLNTTETHIVSVTTQKNVSPFTFQVAKSY